MNTINLRRSRNGQQKEPILEHLIAEKNAYDLSQPLRTKVELPSRGRAGAGLVLEGKRSSTKARWRLGGQRRDIPRRVGGRSPPRRKSHRPTRRRRESAPAPARRNPFCWLKANQWRSGRLFVTGRIRTWFGHGSGMRTLLGIIISSIMLMFTSGINGKM